MRNEESKLQQSCITAAISPSGEVAVRRSERFSAGCCHWSHPQVGGRGCRCRRLDSKEMLCQPLY